MQAILILGCNGYTNQEFVFCKGVENLIVDLDKIKHTQNYIKMIEYLDHIKLFEKTCINANVVSSCMYKIYEFGYITEIQYKLICDFIKQHLRCCLKLELRLKGE